MRSVRFAPYQGMSNYKTDDEVVPRLHLADYLPNLRPMRTALFSLLAAVIVAGALSSPVSAGAEADPRRGSGLPVPRFVSLKSDEINVRSGPGTRYPILWVYRRESLPVEIVEEFEYWRKIRDAEGTMGWVHKTMLDGQRVVMFRGKTQVIRAEPKEDAAPVLRVAPQVLARLLECEAAWCRVQVEGRKGWVRRKVIWGVYEDEQIKK